MERHSVDAIVEALNVANVRYLVAGGLAVVAHGYVRFTADVDLIVDLEPANVTRAVTALESLGYRPRAPVVFVEFADPQNRALWVRDKNLTVFSLNRDVAIKVLPESFANDPDRLARFQREAQVLASLNHPNIAHIYGLERQDGREGQEGAAGPATSFIVMELVEGETLEERLRKSEVSSLKSEGSGLPLDEALAIARQIADALEAAHEQGIIHRDLKPANVKVRPDGTVKVLDFGLAKMMEPASAMSVNAMTSPTLSMHATQGGIILGTAAYMSPEQAAGKPVDKRSDPWAFGVVVYEMLTGRPVFSGETVSHILASVLKSEPDWTALPAGTPTPIRRLLRRCLEKDRKRRLADAADARLEVEEALRSSAAIDSPARPTTDSRRPTRRSTLPWAVAGAAAILAGVL